MKEIRIFLDMDDVIADFTGSACRTHGVNRETMEERRELGKWGIEEPLGLSLPQFWEPINNRGEDFWRDLSVTEHMEEILHVVQRVDPDYLIVSAPPPPPGNVGHAHVGKQLWLEYYLGSSSRLEFVTRKYLFARYPGAVLIDDRQENVEAFIRHGGQGIVFPTTGNTFYQLAKDPVSYVANELEQILGKA